MQAPRRHPQEMQLVERFLEILPERIAGEKRARRNWSFRLLNSLPEFLDFGLLGKTIFVVSKGTWTSFGLANPLKK